LVNNVCIGTAQMGMNYGVANRHGQLKYDEILQIIRFASENKIWYYDTAQSYGDSEIRLGRAFAALGIEDKVRCVSKLHPGKEYDKRQIIDAVRSSVSNLGVSSLWALLAHRVDQVYDDATLGAIRSLKAEGLIDHWGVSIYDPEDALEMVQDVDIDVIQIPFNIMDRRLPDRGLFDLARKHRKKLFIRSIFLQGLIFLTPDEMKQKGMEWAAPYIADLHGRLDRTSDALNEFALAAVSQYAPGTVLIMGIEKLEQLTENISILSRSRLSDSKVKAWWDNLPVYPERLLNPSQW